MPVAANKYVHRDLAIGHSGPDVLQLQHGIRRKAAGWKLPQFAIDLDGRLSPQALSAAVHLLHAMGGHGQMMQRLRENDVLSQYAQQLLRGSRPRTPTMLRLSRKRRPQIREWRQAKAPGDSFRITSRATWGARPPQGSLVPQSIVNEIFIHHTVYPALSANASVEEEKARMRDLQRFHQDSRGYVDVAYQVVVFPTGRAYEGRPLNYQGAHTANRNSTSKAVCFDGNFEQSKPTNAALATAKFACAALAPGKPIRPHGAVYPTACPGKYILARFSELS
jgi:hypothetical protein